MTCVRQYFQSSFASHRTSVWAIAVMLGEHLTYNGPLYALHAA